MFKNGTDSFYVPQPDEAVILYSADSADNDGTLRFEHENGNLKVYITALHSKPEFIKLCWDTDNNNDTLVLGDAWERSYKDLGFLPASKERVLPWYFEAVNGDCAECLGVKVGTNSFVSFKYSDSRAEALFDIRSGSYGVDLNGRELSAGTLVFRQYRGIKHFDALKSFCKELCDKPLYPPYPVYGGNNWYYAYGKSSREEILRDSALQAELSAGLNNRPFMVIDDGWQLNSCEGPWEPNAKFGDMKTLASEMKNLGVRPGIWVRFLYDRRSDIPLSWRISEKPGAALDPTVPEVLSFIAADIKKFKSWGFELIKHDFSTYDLFGDWGRDFTDKVPKKDGYTFHDGTKTNAEIVLLLYKTIRDAAGDTLIIGCNTVSHLSAGLVEINRIGDDTSGKEWARTRDYGVNTLAFRLAQHKAFYDIDADCVGIIDNAIPWEKNRMWLELLADSGTPLFVSCAYESATKVIRAELSAAYKKASEQVLTVEPVDFTEGKLPKLWKTGDTINEYNWD